jgi:hypothetical protein
MTILEIPGAGGGWSSNGDQSSGSSDVPLDGSIVIVARVRTHEHFALILTQADESPLVAGELRLLLAEHPAVFHEERSEDEGETTGTEEGCEVRESRRERRRRGQVQPDHRGQE